MADEHTSSNKKRQSKVAFDTKPNSRDSDEITTRTESPLIGDAPVDPDVVDVRNVRLENGRVSKEKQQELIYDAMQKVNLKKARTARLFMQETCLYFIFISIFCVVTYALRPRLTFFMSDVIDKSLYRNTFQTDKDFIGIINAADWWNWAEAVLLPELQPTEYYAGQDMEVEQRQYSNWYNFVVGQVRIRQLRVQRGDGTDVTICTVPKQFRHAVKYCYPAFDQYTESNANFGPWEQTNLTVHDAFKFKTSDEVCSADRGCPGWSIGVKQEVYPSSGYVWSFSKDLETATKELHMLRENGWTDAQTRAIIVDVTLYNPNIRMLCSSTALLEFHPTGAVVTSFGIKPLKLYGWTEPEDIVFFAGEVLLIVAVLVYFLLLVYKFTGHLKCKKADCGICMQKKINKEGLDRLIACSECSRMFNQFRLPICPTCGNEVPHNHACWRGFFQDPWNILDIANQVIFFTVFFLRLGVRQDLAETNFNVGDNHLNFSSIAWEYATSFWLSSINALFCFVKLFKYLDKVKAMSALVRTVVKARSELFFFFIIFLAVYMGYAMAFHLAFGTDMLEYKDFVASLMTLFLMMNGAFEFKALQESNRILGPLFFITFELTVTLILTNMFIAIVSRAYGQSKEAASNARQTFLSSSLKIFFYEVKFKLADWGLLPKNKALLQVKRLIKSFLDSPGFTDRQIDDIRTFKTEVDHEPNNTELHNVVLRAFNFVVDKKMTDADFTTLKNAVQYNKSNRTVLRIKVWDDDSDEEEEQQMTAHERNLLLTNPDPDIDIEGTFKRMYKAVEYGGVLSTTKKGMLKHKDVFTGTAAVDWLLANVYPGKPRKFAVDVLVFWSRKGFIEHVSLEHGFEDDHKLLYRIVPFKVAEHAVESPRKVMDTGEPSGDAVEGMLKQMIRKHDKDGAEANLGTKLLTNRIKRVGERVGILFEAASQLNDTFEEMTNPADHHLMAIKVTVLNAKNLIKADRFSESDPCLTLVSGRMAVRTTVKRGSNVTWDETFVLKVRRITTIKFLMEDVDLGENDPIGFGSLQVNAALETKLRDNDEGIECTVDLTHKDAPAGSVDVRIEPFESFHNHRELSRLTSKAALKMK